MKQPNEDRVYIDGHYKQTSYDVKDVIALLREYVGYFIITDGLRTIPGKVPCACPTFGATAFGSRELAQQYLDDRLRGMEKKDRNYWKDYSVKEIETDFFREYRRRWAEERKK